MNHKIKTQVKNSIGMFDLFRGIGITCVILDHCIVYLLPDTSVNSFYTTFYYLFNVTFVALMMPMFFCASGYGARKMNPKKNLKKNAGELLAPYAVAAIVSTILHWLMQFLRFHSVKGATKSTIKQGISFLLGIERGRSIFGVELFNCGPCWYLLALMWALCIFNLILNYVPQKMIPVAVLAVSSLGWLLDIYDVVFLSISHGLVAVLHIYIGYLFRKYKIFSNTRWWLLFLGGFIFAYASISLLQGVLPSLLLEYYKHLMIPMAAACALYLFVRMNQGENHFLDFWNTIGKETLLILCIHTVEMTAIPWYSFASFFNRFGDWGVLIMFAIRCLIIYIGWLIIKRGKRLLAKIKKGREADVAQ